MRVPARAHKARADMSACTHAHASPKREPADKQANWTCTRPSWRNPHVVGPLRGNRPHLGCDMLRHHSKVHEYVESPETAQINGQQLLRYPEEGTHHPPDRTLKNIEEASAQTQGEEPHVDHQQVVVLADALYLVDPLRLGLKQHCGEAEDHLVEGYHVGEGCPDNRQWVQHLQHCEHEGGRAGTEGQDLHALWSLLDAVDATLAHVARCVHGRAGEVLGTGLHLGIPSPGPDKGARLTGQLRCSVLDGLEDGVLHCRVG
mmetsp:Transcript_63974/g.190662  ORF Transcript_63974/g.190662 Transcript_63974/m.190662 type:complete len:260 (-) Transcript_63974:247-1026(-)